MEPFLLTLLLSIVSSLKVTNMTVPLVTDTRSVMELSCHFDMENEELYAVKWYKDDHEFFRYTPHQQPQNQEFPVAGVHIVPNSWDCDLSLCRINLTGLSRSHSAGAYRCEISTEAPTFRLASETKDIAVATLPRFDPQIYGLKDSYIEGEIITANCSSAPSDPAPILTWSINNKGAEVFTKNNVPSEPDQEGLMSRWALLVLQTGRKHTQEDDMIEISCKTALPGIPLPPRETRRKIRIRLQESETINNQKFQWSNSSAEDNRASLLAVIPMAVFVFAEKVYLIL